MSSVPEIGTLVGGKYRIARMLGAGGMGIVFEARNELTEKQVALKVLQPQFAARPEHVQRMLREAQASARIRHPNVVDVFDVGSEGDTLFLVMEYLEGETLAARLTRGVLSTAEALALLIPAMRGVAAGHTCGIVHRDVKPDNIFLARQADRHELVPKVLDFGISKVPSLSGEDLSLTASGATLGTPLYMSYEQLSGLRDIDGRADVYAFGVILYQALTGRTPFHAETLGSLAVQVATTTPKLPSELRAGLRRGLDDVVMRAIARSREARYGSLDALILALSPFAGDGTPVLGVDTLPAGFYTRVDPPAADDSSSVAPFAPTQQAQHALPVAIPSRAPGSAREPAVSAYDPHRDRTRLRVALWATSLLALALGYVLFHGLSFGPARDLASHDPTPQRPLPVERRPVPTLPPGPSATALDREASPVHPPPTADGHNTETAHTATLPTAGKRRSKTQKRLPAEASLASDLPQSTDAKPPAPARAQTAPVDQGPVYRAGKPSLDEF